MTIYDQMRSDESKAALSQKTMLLDVDDIEANPLNTAPIEGIEELMELIQSSGGVAEPITVYKVSNRKYRLISGERRWTATKRLGIELIKSNIIEMPSTKGEEIELIDRFNASRPQTEKWNKTRVTALSEAYDEQSANNLIEKGVRKTEWISLRMHGIISARTVQEYLTGKYSDEASTNLDKEKNPKQITLRKINKQLKKLLKDLDEIKLKSAYESYGELNDFENNLQDLLNQIDVSFTDIEITKDSLIRNEESQN